MAGSSKWPSEIAQKTNFLEHRETPTSRVTPIGAGPNGPQALDSPYRRTGCLNIYVQMELRCEGEWFVRLTNRALEGASIDVVGSQVAPIW